MRSVNEVNASELQQAIERQHGGRGTFVQSVSIDERHAGKPVWQGVVHVFDLEGHPTAKRRFYAVLHVPPVNSPADAVRAAIVADLKEKDR